MNRQFFNSNTIQQYKTFSTSFFSANNQNPHTASNTRLKRITSVSSTKLNPQKFINRQAFNNKLYSQKPFNIAVQFKKQNDEVKRIYSFDKCLSSENIKKILSTEKSQQFASVIESIANYLKVIYTEVVRDGENSSQKCLKGNKKLIKKELNLLKEGIQKMCKIFHKEMEYKQSQYLQLLFKLKSQSNQQNLKSTLNQSRIKTANNINHLSRNSQQISLSQLNLPLNSKLLNTFQCSNLSGEKPSTSKYNYQKKISTLTQKIKILQFQNQKKIIQLQKIQQLNEQKNKQIQILAQKLNSTTEKISKVNQIEQFYNYKIKKLQEELEVAHIVKEQNLMEKMKYILQVAVAEGDDKSRQQQQ